MVNKEVFVRRLETTIAKRVSIVKHRKLENVEEKLGNGNVKKEKVYRTTHSPRLLECCLRMRWMSFNKVKLVLS